jgi:cytochrome c biogenesis protein CcdA
VILDGGLFIVPEMRRYLFGALVVLGLLSELFYIKKQHNPIETKWLKYAFAILLIAFGIWILDLTKVVCEPTSLWQGHTLWHILSAIAIYLLHLYYRHEKDTNQTKSKL